MGTPDKTCRTVNGADVNAKQSFIRNINSIISGGDIVDTILSAVQKDGRGNISPTTIILPTLAMMTKDKDKFLKLLDKKIYEAKDSLLERFDYICSQSPNAAKFMYENNTMCGYIPSEGIKSALSHGTLVIGLLGLAETLQILIGKDQTTLEGMELAKEILGLYKKRCAEFKEKYSLNFGVYFTPAESLCHTALKKFKDAYGVIPNVSDKEFFTNSTHVPVWKNISPFKKAEIEAELAAYSSAGCIFYAELDGGMENNIDALEQFVNFALDKDNPYVAINIPNDTCLECGFTGEFNDCCPECGSSHIQQLRRVTGYLTGNYKTAFNKGKQDEVEHRIRHSAIVHGIGGAEE